MQEKVTKLLRKKDIIENKLWFGFLALFIATFISFSAQAACTSPAGGAGKLIYNADDEVMQYCDDTNWIAMGPVPGTGGAGCSNPIGGVGKLIYNVDNSIMQYCDGAAWVAIGPSSKPTTTGLIGHWKLDESSGSSITDSSSIGNNGTWSDGADNNVTSETTSAIVSSGLDFDGSNDGIDVSSNPAYGTTSFTASAWVYIDGSIPSGWKTIIEHDRLDANWYGLWKSANSTAFHCRWADNGTGTWSSDFSTIISADTWYHVACTYDSATDTAHMYLNGSLDNTVSSTGASSSANADTITIGKNNSNAEHFNAIIDDARLYNRALSSSEISVLYQFQSGALGGCSNPTGTAGKMIYNSDNNIMQYCNGIEWVGIGK